ncbi:hypothetical protein, partial [Klebsiella pneumoniae]|uniref:hypothetical protein n=1 Tax=Klebsiella pneumoniae TaxID=573 RepID=UPI001C7076E2
RALAPPPRLRAKHASFCALCADCRSPASAGTAGQKHRFKNCANLCAFLHYIKHPEGVLLLRNMSLYLRYGANAGNEYENCN